MGGMSLEHGRGGLVGRPPGPSYPPHHGNGFQRQQAPAGFPVSSHLGALGQANALEHCAGQAEAPHGPPPEGALAWPWGARGRQTGGARGREAGPGNPPKADGPTEGD